MATRLPGGPPKVISSSLRRFGGRLVAPVGSALSRSAEREGLVLTLRDDAGRCGQGEASPLPGFSTETLQDCERALTAVHQRITGADEEGWPIVEELAALRAARFAFETAIADLQAQAAGVSVAELLGGPRPYSQVAVQAVCGSLLEARSAVAAGVRTLKIKIGGVDFGAELALLRELRAELGPEVALRLDANGAWSPHEARRRMEQLTEVAPEFVEQPVPAGQLADLLPAPLPIAADESLRSPAERAALLGAADCVAWVIKPAVMGLRMAREIACIAQKHDKCVILSHLFDGPIALAACCELALSLPRAPSTCGLRPHAGLSAWPGVALPHFGADAAVARAHGRTGLGLALPEGAS